MRTKMSRCLLIGLTRCSLGLSAVFDGTDQLVSGTLIIQI